MKDLIAIHGPLNGGKDTVADYLISKFAKPSGQYQFSYRRYAFARPLKEACKVMFGFTNEQLEDRVLKEAVDEFWGFTPRRALQLLGTEYGRDMLRKDIWVKRAELEVKNNIDEHGVSTIITDVRFQNEADWVRAQPSATLIYLIVPDLEKDEKYNHTSEAGITRADTDVVIINDKSKGLQHLYDQLDKQFN
jgi:hypothetical protein